MTCDVPEWTVLQSIIRVAAILKHFSFKIRNF